MKIQVQIMSNGQPMTRILSSWLYENKLDWYYGSQEYGIDLARNQNITRFLREDCPRGFTHLLTIDNDMIPIRETRHILRGEDELAYCGYVGRHGSKGHYGNDDFGCACARYSVAVLKTLSPVWFKTTERNGVRIECECTYFANHAKLHGYKSKMVGLIGHEQKCILIPTDNNYEVLWEEWQTSNTINT